MGETTVNFWGKKKLVQSNFVFIVKFLLNSKETYWKLYGEWSLDVVLLKDYAGWQPHSQIKVFGSKS